jgi:acyl-coenzyme A thioesterase PaaI-like protein
VCARVPLRHHDVCFGCGQANLFGLQLEAERRDDGSVEGRFFVKQDHQGPPGVAHGGVVAAALEEAMALAAGTGDDAPTTVRFELDLRAPAPVGAFVRLRAEVVSDDNREVEVRAAAYGEEAEEPLAEARSVQVRPT